MIIRCNIYYLNTYLYHICAPSLRGRTSKSSETAINMASLSLGSLAALGNESVNRDVTYEDVLKTTKDPNVLLIDVRNPDEIAGTGIIPSAINVPLAEFKEALSSASSDSFLQQYHRDKPNTDSYIVIYCRSGVRAQTALNSAFELGYNNAKRYPGSWNEWFAKQKENDAEAALS